jgi:MATE family multidrug resistance protein
MAAMGVCNGLYAFAVIFMDGSSNALLPIGGVLFGAGRLGELSRLLRAALLFVLALSGLTAALLLAFPGAVGVFFGIDGASALAVQGHATRLFALSLPFMGLNYVLRNYFSAVNRPTLSTVLALLDNLVFVLALAWGIASFSAENLWLCFALSSAFVMMIAARFVKFKE